MCAGAPAPAGGQKSASVLTLPPALESREEARKRGRKQTTCLFLSSAHHVCMLSFLLSSPPDLEPDARRAFLFLISGARQLFCFARSLAVDVFSTDMTNEQCITFRGGKLGAGTGAGGRGPGQRLRALETERGKNNRRPPQLSRGPLSNSSAKRKRQSRSPKGLPPQVSDSSCPFHTVPISQSRRRPNFDHGLDSFNPQLLGDDLNSTEGLNRMQDLPVRFTKRDKRRRKKILQNRCRTSHGPLPFPY